MFDITLAEDGRMFFTSSDGTEHEVGEPSQRKASFAKASIRGAHIGGHWQARRQGFRDAEAFWREHLLGAR